MTVKTIEPSGFRWLYKCHPWSSSSSITVGLFASPHKLNVAVIVELLLLVSDSFFSLPARIAPRTIISPGATRTVCWLFANVSSIPSPFCLKPVSLSPIAMELPPSV
ncbi:hypothetical protein FK688_24135, partial [Salmonella enterica subsp. enterica serovar Schwarzengrund]|nr:hypothetical protein [Salmonella enterica subsp. enterica serovar Schwarzengrund]